MLDLRAAWGELLARRPSLKPSLEICGDLLEAWAGWEPRRWRPSAWSAEACAARWGRGLPLLDDAALDIPAEEVEDLLARAVEVLSPVVDERAALERLGEAWDAGVVTPASLVPRQGRIGAPDLPSLTALSTAAIEFLACATLRPPLEVGFATARDHLTAGDWDLGVCPFCGGPPGFADVVESGQRRLACNLCGGTWTFGRVRCPFCGTEESRDLVRLVAEGADEGYFISACRRCRAYVKELDRRTRWNGGPPTVEDWGSPHLDLVATRAGYWRPGPSLVGLVRSSSS